MKNISLFPASYLHKHLDYDPTTGLLFWTLQKPGRRTDKPIISKNRGYIRFMLDGKFLYAQDVIWKMSFGEDPSDDVDHINRLRTDNRLSNLRSATRGQNSWNNTISQSNSSGVTGVYETRHGKWTAQITLPGKRTLVLGTYNTLEESAAVRREAELRLRGEYARNAA